MRRLPSFAVATTVMVACLTLLATTADADHRLSAAPAAKPAAAGEAPPVDPAVIRQGGDTIADAVPIPIPYTGTGTTVGYANDYDEMCPYGGWGPDVVYVITPDTDLVLDIDLCGSDYDTKLLVYDQNLDLVACNDDYYGGPPCGAFVSKIEFMPVGGGQAYYIIVDGYGSSAGVYQLAITVNEPCELTCWPGADTEDEPPLVVDYEDLHNGGCNTDPGAPPMQIIGGGAFCGRAGFYSYGGASFRDTDWFLVDFWHEGVIEITAEAELATRVYELGPQDCGAVGVLQELVLEPCTEGVLTIVGQPWTWAWVWVGAAGFEAPGGEEVLEYDYRLQIDRGGDLPVEARSWSAVKGLFR